MIFGIPSLIFWGILIIAAGTIIGSILIHKGSKGSTTAIVKEDGDFTRTIIKEDGDSTRSVIKKQSAEAKTEAKNHVAELKKEVGNQAKETNKLIEESTSSTNQIIENQTKKIEDKIEQDGKLTRNSMSEQSDTKLIKEQLIRKLKPAISNVNEAFLQAHLSRNTKNERKSHNDIFTANRPLRAEIANCISLAETIVDENLKNDLIDYLNRLKQPSRKFDNGLMTDERDKILKEQAGELNRLEKEFQDIYSRILKLE